MKNISLTAKWFALLSLISGSIWIGSYLSRLFTVYGIFEGPELALRSFVNDQNISGILYSFLPVILTPFISFIVMIVAFILFVITSKISLKENGWLFIILIGIIVTLPFEVYLMLIDYKIIMTLMSSSFDSNSVITLLKDRIKDLSSFPIVIVLTYISFFFFIVFKPLTKTKKI